LQDGGIEAGEQFVGDNDEFQRVSRVTEAVEQFFFCVFVECILFLLLWIARVRVHNDSTGFRADQLIHHRLQSM
jgi:hypothetical protein